MGYLLDKQVPRKMLDDDSKLQDLQELHAFVKQAQTKEGNILGFYATVKSGASLVEQVQKYLRAIRPILAEKDKEHLDEDSLTADWLSNVEDDDVLINAIPKYQVSVSRRLVLKMADKNNDLNRSQAVWLEVLRKFDGKDGSINLMRTLLGLASRKRFTHPLFMQGLQQLYSKHDWMIVQFMKRLNEIDPIVCHRILSEADWLTDDEVRKSFQ